MPSGRGDVSLVEYREVVVGSLGHTQQLVVVFCRCQAWLSRIVGVHSSLKRRAHDFFFFFFALERMAIDVLRT